MCVSVRVCKLSPIYFFCSMFSVLTLRVNTVLCHFGPQPMQNVMLVLELEHLTEGETVVQLAVSASHSSLFPNLVRRIVSLQEKVGMKERR